MSFRAVWGFDPEDVERANQKFKAANSSPQGFDEDQQDEEVVSDVGVDVPYTPEAQVYELRRMFRL